MKGYREDNGKCHAVYQLRRPIRARGQTQLRKPYICRHLDGKEKRADLATPFNFVTTNDITGGNSGSPVINRRAEIVGLVFEATFSRSSANFIYDEAQTAPSPSTRAG